MLYTGYTPYIASLPNQIMTDDWYSALEWLGDNSPDPFSNPDLYYDLYPPQNEFVYPPSAYGVMSWWDYGYFIMQIAHRIPNANPTQTGAPVAGKFFTAENETAADQVADKAGTKYVVIDYLMATTAKFYAMAQWAGLSSDDFYGIYYIPPPSGQTTGQFAYLFYPTYYQSIAARLYNFDGKAQAGKQPVVISYEDRTTSTGFEYRAVTAVQPFSTYEQAQTYVASQTTGNWRIVGVDPFTSIVPLEAVTDYQLVYTTQSSNETIQQGQPVKIFEYLSAS